MKSLKPQDLPNVVGAGRIDDPSLGEPGAPEIAPPRWITDPFWPPYRPICE